MELTSVGPTPTALENYLELQKPIYHTPVVLGISHFKRELKINFPNLKKSLKNKLIASFKKRSWMEYHGVARHRGTFPTHHAYGKSVKVSLAGIKDAEFEIKVTNNGKPKQK